MGRPAKYSKEEIIDVLNFLLTSLAKGDKVAVEKFDYQIENINSSTSTGSKLRGKDTEITKVVPTGQEIKFSFKAKITKAE